MPSLTSPSTSLSPPPPSSSSKRSSSKPSFLTRMLYPSRSTTDLHTSPPLPSPTSHFPPSPSISLPDALAQLEAPRPPPPQDAPPLLWALVAALEAGTKVPDDPQGTRLLGVASGYTTPSASPELRLPAFHILAHALSPPPASAPTRALLFSSIVTHSAEPSLPLAELAARLAALIALTRNGRDAATYSVFSKTLRLWLHRATEEVRSERQSSERGRRQSAEAAHALPPLSGPPSLAERTSARILALMEGYIKSSISQIRSIVLTKLVLAALATHADAPPNPTDTPPLLQFLRSLLAYAYVPPAAVAPVVACLCAIIGAEEEGEWSHKAWSVLRNLLRSQCASMGAKALRDIPLSDPSPPLPTHLGALRAIRRALLRVRAHPPAQPYNSTVPEEDAINTFTPAFVLPAFRRALDERSDALDGEVWRFAGEWMDALEVSAAVEGDGKESGRVGSGGGEIGEEEGEGWEALAGLLEAGRDRVLDFRFRDGSVFTLPFATPTTPCKTSPPRTAPLSLSSYSTLLSRLLSRYPSYPPTLSSLLLSLSAHLPEPTALALIRHSATSGACIPSSPNWLQNVRALVERFYLGPAARPPTRVAVARLLFEHVVEGTRDVPVFREQFLSRILLPLLEQTLADETDLEIEAMAWEYLGLVAVGEAVEEDEEERRKRDEVGERLPDKEPAPARGEYGADPPDSGDGGDGGVGESKSISTASDDSGSIPSVLGGADAARPVTFERIRALLNTLARHRDPSEPPSRQPAAYSISPGEIRVPADAPLTMMSLVSAPAAQRITSPRPGTVGLPPIPADGEPSTATTTTATRSKSLGAVLTLINVFDKLAFSPPHSLTTSKLARAPASRRCILIWRDLLALLAPASKVPSSVDSPPLAAADRPPQISSRARLAILQFFFRLRADRDHRIFPDKDMDEAIMPTASILHRVHLAETIPANEQAEERLRRAMSVRSPPAPASENGGSERGREARRRSRDIERSRDRSRSASRAPVARVAQEILWSVPESLPFKLTQSQRPAVGLITWDASWGASGEDVAGRQVVPLPVSEYVRTLVAILEHERDWELVSYVLCHLPVQLANKNFFSGPRASTEIRALRSALCAGILRDRLGESVLLPPGIKRTEVHAVTYQTLTTLIAYRPLFDKAQHDEMVEAFMQGLSMSHLTARPCVHALVMCCYELQPSMTKYISAALHKLSQVMSAASMGSHILEFLVAVGHIPPLYANFTQAEYRLVFGLALKYIEHHHTALAERKLEQERFPDRYRPLSSGEQALAEHVLLMAYYTIYLWFLSIRLADRARYVPIIVRGLLVAAEHTGAVDEQSEVCFDMIMRYAYSNVNPRTIRSPLSDLVVAGGGKKPATVNVKHWIQGNAVVSVEALDRAGWAQVVVRRPSGTMTMLCKLENVPLVGREGDLLDMTSVHTLLTTGSAPPQPQPTASSRVIRAPPLFPDEEQAEEPKAEEAPTEENDPTSSASENAPPTPAPAPAEPSGPQPTLSKDLLMPGHLALQLSTYPDISATHPRARLLPNDAACERFIRGLDSHQVVDSHKIGVLFVGRGQSSETEILGNTQGSPQYVRFLSRLGNLIRLKGHEGYTGGLDRETDMDGKYAYAWWDDIDQVVFHVATLMPNHAHDPQHRHKKAHIGNDFVRIVWNGSGLPYALDTVKSQFNFVNILISPHSKGVPVHRPLGAPEHVNDEDFYRVELQRRPGMPDFGPLGNFKIVSTEALPHVIRQMSLFADLLSQVYVQVEENLEFVSSWRRRLQAIKLYRDRLPPPVDDGPPPDGVLGQEASRDFSRFV